MASWTRTVRDLASEAEAAVLVSPARTIASIISIVLAVAGFVTAYGLSLTLAGQVSDTFDALRATEVVVTTTEAGELPSDSTTPLCGGLNLADARRLAGVRRAGLMLITTAPATSALHPEAKAAIDPLIGIDADGVQAIAPHLTAGRLFDDGAAQRGDSVALVPASAAERLGVSGIGDSILVGGRAFWVLGLFDSVGRRPEALSAIIVPSKNLTTLPEPPVQAECRVVVETDPGAAAQVATQIATALDPGNPARFTVTSPPDPTTFRRSLEGPVQQLSLVLSTVMLLLGLLSIAFAANNSVTTRTAEFGLRQSLGATPHTIAAQVILENTFLGFLGGILGSYLGAATVLAISLANQWAPILDLGITLGAAALCGLLGALAAVIPAIRAAKLDPVEALRA